MGWLLTPHHRSSHPSECYPQNTLLPYIPLTFTRNTRYSLCTEILKQRLMRCLLTHASPACKHDDPAMHSAPALVAGKRKLINTMKSKSIEKICYSLLQRHVANFMLHRAWNFTSASESMLQQPLPACYIMSYRIRSARV